MPHPRRAAMLAAALLATALAPPAASPHPTPFGHACQPKQDVRFCPTVGNDDRPTSFDGTPLDVDVTLPATGDGPFPTILLLHGLGGTKTSFQGDGSTGYDDVTFARRGYAVVMPTARGFGGSCGRPDARTAGCEKAWARLADMRYEVRDLQTLVGKLVDQGIANPDAVGSTGVSYGGGMSTMLAYLKDRIRNEDGSFSPWTSPNGTPIRLAAAWPRWLWSNGESIFTRNGRGPWARSPQGVPVKNYADGIFAVPTLAGFVAPGGSELSADITTWKALLDKGTESAQTQQVLDNAYNYHGVAGIAKDSPSPAPLLLQSGWTDALFPVPQALGAYDDLMRKKANVQLQVADLGHDPGANHTKDVQAFNVQGYAFFDTWLQGKGTPATPGAVTAYTMSCPKTSPAGGGPFRATSFKGLARDSLRFSTGATLRITSKGANAKLGELLKPLLGNLCTTYKPDRTSKATIGTLSPGVTLIGQPVVTAKVAAKGRYGQVDARLWDLNPKSGKQRLITRGTYRLTTNQKGTIKVPLDGNGWKFAKGHRIVVELLGRDAPTYLPSPTAWSATLKQVRVSMPVRENVK